MELEAELIKRSKNGDVDAFERLISPYQKKILNFAYRMLASREDAEDAAQEVFVKAYKALGSFDAESGFSTWLYKIASNTCLDELRRRKRRGDDKSISINRESEDGEYELPLHDETNSPYLSAQKKEAHKALASAIEQLGEEHRAVVVMRDINGLSYEEIARITDSAVGTVKSRLCRARLILRKILEKDRELFIE